MTQHFSAIDATADHLPSGFHKAVYQTTPPEGWKLVQDVSTKDRTVIICKKL